MLANYLASNLSMANSQTPWWMFRNTSCPRGFNRLLMAWDQNLVVVSPQCIVNTILELLIVLIKHKCIKAILSDCSTKRGKLLFCRLSESRQKCRERYSFLSCEFTIPISEDINCHHLLNSSILISCSLRSSGNIWLSRCLIIICFRMLIREEILCWWPRGWATWTMSRWNHHITFTRNRKGTAAEDQFDHCLKIAAWLNKSTFKPYNQVRKQ